MPTRRTISDAFLFCAQFTTPGHSHSTEGTTAAMAEKSLQYFHPVNASTYVNEENWSRVKTRCLDVVRRVQGCQGGRDIGLGCQEMDTVVALGLVYRAWLHVEYLPPFWS